MAVELNRIKQGCCVVCDLQVFDVLRSFPADSDHPYAGEAKICKTPVEGVKIVTLILSDGSQLSQPVCGDCEITPQNLPEIWRKNLSAWWYECEHRASLGAKALTARQKELQIEHLTERAAKVIPLGVLHTDMRSINDRYFQRVGR